MRNLLMFHGSCGHTTIKEISDKEWVHATTPFRAVGAINIVENFQNRFRVGRKTRMVYIYPFRYCICEDCLRSVVEDLERT